MWSHTCRAVADEHGVILPVIIVDLVLLQRGGQDFPCRIIQANFETLKIIGAFLPNGFRRGDRVPIGIR